MTKRIRDDGGQATVEFALVLPVLLLLLLGIIEFGKAWNLAQIATDAVREGTRYCVIADNTGTYTNAWVETHVKNLMARAGVPTAVSDVQITGECDGSTEGVTITLTIPYRWMFFNVALRPIDIKSSFTMRNE
jgi:Flp pilus assembly protein TadG